MKLDVDLRTDLRHAALHRRHHGGQGKSGADQDVGVFAGSFVLVFGKEGDGLRFLAQRAVLGVLHHPDDFKHTIRLSLVALQSEDFPETIRAAVVLLRERLIHDGHLHARRDIVIVKIPPGKNRRFERGEVARHHARQKR